MFDRLVLAHELIERVGVVASHYEADQARALPPDAVLVTTFGEEEPRREPDRDGLSRPWPLEAKQLSNTVPQAQQSKQVKERDRTLRVIVASEVVVSQILEEPYRFEW